MRRIVMRLPEEDSAEFIFMSPFTPRGKDNLAAWMVARNDGEHYGDLLIYHFPKQSLVYGPQQVVNRMNQDPEIARQVFPIDEALIYVRPLYLRAEGGRIHQLERVIVAYQNQVVMERTLEDALSRLFAGAAGVLTPPRIAAADSTRATPTTSSSLPNAELADLLRQAREHYERAISAQRAGNWAQYQLQGGGGGPGDGLP
jgi:uncharacterized membrane protein (UPF0182 family)